MNKQVDSWIDARSGEIVESLQKLIRCESVRDEACAPNAPFGKGCRDALDSVLALCKEQGFECTDMDGYIGFADFGSGDETLGILTHVDVVPAGEGWSSPAYEANIIDGVMIGRGTLDDKGPAITAIYALAAVKEAGYEFRRKVRLLFGCDEECGMGCLKHYIEHQPLPDMAFSPDADYPVVNSEKNIYHGVFTKKFPSSLSFEAGTVANAVPASAVVKAKFCLDAVKAAAAEHADWFDIQEDGSGVVITAKGVAAHASMPEAGKNAIQRMIWLLNKLPLEGEDKAAIDGLYNALKLDYYGESLDLDRSDDSGRLTLNAGLMSWNEEGFALTLDIRAPISVTHELLKEKLIAGFSPFGAELTEDSFSQGYCLSEDSEIVKKLMEVYFKRTGDPTPPKRLGGGTYARHLKNAVAFGPERANRENRIHMTDEAIHIVDLIDNTKIIADAIIALACK